MDEIWFIYIDGRQEGPFSLFDLRRDPRMASDTLVWKKGFLFWKKAKDVPELKDLFAEAEEEENEEEDPLKKKGITNDEEMVLDFSPEPPVLFLLAAILLLLIYVFIQMLQRS